MKVCKTCKKELPILCFRRHKTTTDKRHGSCKNCQKLKRKRKEANNANPNMEGTKTCKRCGSNKNRRCFVKNKSCKDGLNGWCKDCSKDALLISKYDITLNQYNSTLKQQDYKCAICRTDKPGGRRNTFVVDHCHSSGNVRGLLCNHCNTGIGKLKDSPELLLKAIEYLKRK